MLRTRWLVLVALVATSCGTSPVATLAVDTTGPPPTVELAAVPAEHIWTPDELAYIESQLAFVGFLDMVTEVEAAVPQPLKVARWCEAGRYFDMPTWSTNYVARTHGHRGASGGYQITRPTWLAWRGMVPGAEQWDAAYLAPSWVQDQVATAGYWAGGGDLDPWMPSAGCWRPRLR